MFSLNRCTKDFFFPFPPSSFLTPLSSPFFFSVPEGQRRLYKMSEAFQMAMVSWFYSLCWDKTRLQNDFISTFACTTLCIGQTGLNMSNIHFFLIIHIVWIKCRGSSWRLYRSPDLLPALLSVENLLSHPGQPHSLVSVKFPCKVKPLWKTGWKSSKLTAAFEIHLEGNQQLLSTGRNPEPDSLPWWGRQRICWGCRWFYLRWYSGLITWLDQGAAV